MTFREDIRLPKPSNIAHYLPKRDAAVLLTIMLEIDRVRGDANARNHNGTQETNRSA